MGCPLEPLGFTAKKKKREYICRLQPTVAMDKITQQVDMPFMVLKLIRYANTALSTNKHSGV